VAGFHPLLISPGIVEVPNPGGRPGGYFPEKREWVSFVDHVMVVLRDDMVFVESPFADSGNESFPDSRLVPSGAKRTDLRVPFVEIPTTDTRSAFGAQTAKYTPSVPCAVVGGRPNFSWRRK